MKSKSGQLTYSSIAVTDEVREEFDLVQRTLEKKYGKMTKSDVVTELLNLWVNYDSGLVDVTQLDVAAKTPVEVEIRADGTVLWVHHKGITVLRVCQIPSLTITDHRKDNNGVG